MEAVANLADANQQLAHQLQEAQQQIQQMMANLRLPVTAPAISYQPQKPAPVAAHIPASFPQTSTTKVATIRQQRSNLNTRQQTKPRYLVPPDLLQPSGYNMDQSDK